MLNNVIVSNIEENQLSSPESPYTISLRRDDFEDEKQFVKFIKNCEKLVRGSSEYSYWREYLREVLGEYACDITGEINSQTTVDIHHHPFTLFLIIKGVVRKYLDNCVPFCTFDICMDAIELHYKNKIGYIPLLSSLHEKYHNGFLLLPMELVHGNYKSFQEEYSKYLEVDDISDIQEKLDITYKNCGWEKYNWMKDRY